MKALIIDDEEDVRDIVAMCLHGTAEVHEASDGSDGVALARRMTPDFILLDVLLRGESGEEVFAKLRSDAATTAIPIIFLTGLHGTGDVERLRQSGAAGVITKPIDVRTFAASVTSLLEGSTPPAAMSSSDAVLDEEIIDALIDLGGEDGPEFLRELIGDFLADAPPRIEAIASAVSSSDHDLALREAHALKSAAGNLGAMAMSKAAAAIERDALSGGDLQPLSRALQEEFDRVRAALRQRLER